MLLLRFRLDLELEDEDMSTMAARVLARESSVYCAASDALGECSLSEQNISDVSAIGKKLTKVLKKQT